MKEQTDQLLKAAAKEEDCKKCASRLKDEAEKKVIEVQIAHVYEEVIQLEQALIELDEQNTLNAMEIRKREAKCFLITKQLEELDEFIRQVDDKENEQAAEDEEIDTDAVTTERTELEGQMSVQKEQILILNESTKQNLMKRQSMKEQMYENYQSIRQIRENIGQKIENDDVRDYLELVIKNNFLESQNVQLLLNL